MRAVADLPGISVVRTGWEPLGEDRWRAAAYARDEALEEARALGAAVTVLAGTEELAASRAALAEAVERAERGRG
ncbi:hypothetical protein [Nonomuraea endophytica]|uniref:Uncharacterized protein n=1 Tax=Nonomuraea endophytica TaxID=714136 RepID=A0A7W8EFZ4_9ACTN|nr:hypothetical protein [Nonomuraea endophytica]MBB5079315.1 hypothetical protein [Nonomuraea endophytica]